MITKEQYTNKDERNSILEKHKDKYLIKEKNISDGSFLIFTNIKPIELGISELNRDINNVAELTTIVAMDKDDIAEMLVYALQKIDELEGRLND